MPPKKTIKNKNSVEGNISSLVLKMCSFFVRCLKDLAIPPSSFSVAPGELFRCFRTWRKPQPDVISFILPRVKMGSPSLKKLNDCKEVHIWCFQTHQQKRNDRRCPLPVIACYHSDFAPFFISTKECVEHRLRQIKSPHHWI